MRCGAQDGVYSPQPSGDTTVVRSSLSEDLQLFWVCGLMAVFVLVAVKVMLYVLPSVLVSVLLYMLPFVNISLFVLFLLVIWLFLLVFWPFLLPFNRSRAPVEEKGICHRCGKETDSGSPVSEG